MLKKTYNKCKICGCLTLGHYCLKHKIKIQEDEGLKRVLERARDFNFNEEEQNTIKKLIKLNDKNL